MSEEKESKRVYISYNSLVSLPHKHPDSAESSVVLPRQPVITPSQHRPNTPSLTRRPMGAHVISTPSHKRGG